MAFALEELSIYREVIISEWKMFVQEGKALRSAESSLTHMLSTPLDSSASQQRTGRSLQGRWDCPGITHLYLRSPRSRAWIQALVCHREAGSEARDDDSSRKKKNADGLTFFLPLTN